MKKFWPYLVILMAVAALLPAARGPESEWLEVDDFSPARIAPVFEKNGYQVEKHGEGLGLRDEKGNKVSVYFDDRLKLMSFVMWFEFKGLLMKPSKLSLANDINTEMVITRATVDAEGDLRFDYWINFSRGMSEDQLISSLEAFVSATGAGLRLKDRLDAVK